LLDHAPDSIDLHAQALNALQDCFTLMAWQIELVDHNTGQLSLDSSEQTSLIEAFAFQVGQRQFQPSLRPGLFHSCLIPSARPDSQRLMRTSRL
jgi:hypothetical protein